MTRFTDEQLGAIKGQVRLSEIIGRTVRLKRRGKDFVGLSPFSNEKTPSFYVHDDKGFYKCFSTQKGGDVFTWLMEVERLTFAQAVEKMAEELGIELRPPSAQETEAAKTRARILQCLEWAQDYFMRALFWSDSPDGKAARAYLSGRQLYQTNGEVSTAGIGWAPATSHAMQKQAQADGFSLDELEGAGLVRKADNGQFRAFFRDRLTLPVRDLQGRVIGFTARALKEAQQPKYLNTPETPVFTKGAAMFGLHAARGMIAKGKDLHVVEGCFDAERLRLHGIAAAAPLGTAMTAQQLELAWRLSESPVLTFDGDAAGKRAAWLAAEKALPLLRGGRALRFIILPEGEDPDSLLLKGGKLPKPVSHFTIVWDYLVDGLNLTDPTDRVRFRERGKHMLDSIADQATRQEWRGAMNMRFGQTRPPGTPSQSQEREKRQAVTREAKRHRPRLGEPEATAAALLMSLLSEPSRVDDHLETLAGLPCGRFTPLRDFLVAQDGETLHLTEPWAKELQADLEASGMAPARYSRIGWDRAARALAARFPQQ